VVDVETEIERFGRPTETLLSSGRWFLNVDSVWFTGLSGAVVRAFAALQLFVDVDERSSIGFDRSTERGKLEHGDAC
jgi:hypothetical protein